MGWGPNGLTTIFFDAQPAPARLSRDTSVRAGTVRIGPPESSLLRVELVGDSFVGDVQELRAAAAHLDGDVAQGRALEFETGRLAMIRTADRFQFSRRMLLKFLYGHPQSILA